MGLISGLLGHVSETNVEKIEEELADIVIDGEHVSGAYKLVRDLVVFTNHRLILIDKQGVTGKKTEYQSIPYRSITRFSKETSGHFDLDAELKIWIRGEAMPLSVEFKKDKNIHAIYRHLSEGVLA